MKISKKQLLKIIKEEHEQYEKDDELRQIGMNIASLLELTEEISNTLHQMGMRYGEMAAVGTYAKMTLSAAQKLDERFNNSLDNMSKYRDTFPKGSKPE